MKSVGIYCGDEYLGEAMEKVLCGANAQSMKYYFNEEQFGKLPKMIQDELKALCVSYCADVGGAVTMIFDDENHLSMQTIQPIDEIGAELLIRRIQREKQELFEQLETFAAEFVK